MPCHPPRIEHNNWRMTPRDNCSFDAIWRNPLSQASWRSWVSVRVLPEIWYSSWSIIPRESTSWAAICWKPFVQASVRSWLTSQAIVFSYRYCRYCSGIADHNLIPSSIWRCPRRACGRYVAQQLEQQCPEQHFVACSLGKPIGASRRFKYWWIASHRLRCRSK